jgi:cytochrome c peroxidase
MRTPHDAVPEEAPKPNPPQTHAPDTTRTTGEPAKAADDSTEGSAYQGPDAPKDARSTPPADAAGDAAEPTDAADDAKGSDVGDGRNEYATASVGGTSAPTVGSGRSSGTGWSAGTGTSSHKGEPRSSRPVDDRPVAQRIEADGRYAEGFRATFGSDKVSTARLAKAIAAFVATLRSTESAYDRFVAGETEALTAAQRRGLALFEGRAGCAQCHVATAPRAGERAEFTDHAFHNTGIAARSAYPRPTTPDAAPRLPYDEGRAAQSRSRSDRGAFKTPSLRDVATRGPFMHDGSLGTLEQVVRHYARGGFADENLDPRLRRFAVTRRDVADLVAFLESLTSDVRPGLAPDLGSRAGRTTLRFVDAAGKPVAAMPVTLDPVGDSLPGDVAIASPTRSLVTDTDGVVSYAPGRRTHTRLTVPDGIDLVQGAWIPDTCRERTIALPVAGRATLLLCAPRGAAVPTALVATTSCCRLTDDLRRLLAAYAPDTLGSLQTRAGTFRLEGSVEILGRTYARYGAWIAAGAPKSATVCVPTAKGAVAKPVDLVPGRETRVDLE